MRRWIMVVGVVSLLGVGVSIAQIGTPMDAAQMRATGEYMSLVIKLNQLHTEYCRPPVPPALPRTVEVCEGMARLIDPKPSKKGPE